MESIDRIPLKSAVTPGLTVRLALGRGKVVPLRTASGSEAWLAAGDAAQAAVSEYESNGEGADEMSHGPKTTWVGERFRHRSLVADLVELRGLEPRTPCMPCRCSSS